MDKNKLSHHIQYEYCSTRPQYRASKQLTAVKVYTVANESKHLLIFGVPRINLIKELKTNLQKYGGGAVKSIEIVTDAIAKETNLSIERFTDCFHCVFEKLEHSRRAKKYLDRQNFYGGILHISYATEYENISNVREKLKQRIAEVAFRITINGKNKINPLNNESDEADDDNDNKHFHDNEKKKKQHNNTK